MSTSGKLLEEYLRGDECKSLEKQIIAKEEQLLKIANEEIKKLYYEIDFLCCKQNELIKDLLINY